MIGAELNDRQSQVIEDESLY